MSVHKRYSADVRQRIVLELLGEERSLQEIAAAYGVSAQTIMRWKRRFVAEKPEVLRELTIQAEKEYEKEKALVAQLERKNEQLTREVERLEKIVRQLKSS